ncbi:PREDICTED: putative F-box protein At3g23950 [Tarenaya hassleriana]|uniref:putative F-box protein At3g23950 n=1 Tax=Tarenaya hassleriana TaxID=28532 RepID=UPI00053C2888|nr:PREDICTED: putative F-box protein At3g23950 [Tarenaya hassleriana]
MDLPEEVLAGILANSSFRDIVRFKLVCREWKSLIESAHFRRLFHSTNHDLSSSAWSLVSKGDGSMNEVVSHCGRDGHCLSRSLGSYTSSFVRDLIRFKDQEDDEKPELQATRQKIRKVKVVACTDGLVLLSVKPLSGSHAYYVSNPVLRQWVEIPPSHQEDHHFKISGLVTRVENGVVSGYKVVRMETVFVAKPTSSDVRIYSSETGEWTIEKIQCPRAVDFIVNFDPVNLNGSLYWLQASMLSHAELNRIDQAIISLDLYADGSEADRVRTISLPDHQPPISCRHNFLTTSGGFLMHIRMLRENGNPRVRVWKKSNGSDDWVMMWDMNTTCLEWVPKAMHPFETDVIYMWSPNAEIMVSFNMRTPYGTCQRISSKPWRLEFLSQFVLPRWLESLPSPPNLTLNVLPRGPA